LEHIGLVPTNVRDMVVDAGIDQNPEEIGRITTLAVISLIQAPVSFSEACTCSSSGIVGMRDWITFSLLA